MEIVVAAIAVSQHRCNERSRREIAEDAASISSVEPRVKAIGEVCVVIILGLRVPGFRMRANPDFTILVPLCANVGRNGIGQPPRNENRHAVLLPMGQATNVGGKFSAGVEEFGLESHGRRRSAADGIC
jgi:hypothetical protein